MKRHTAIACAMLLVTASALAVTGASRCAEGEAPLGNGFVLRLPRGFCEYHFPGPDFVTGRVVDSTSNKSLLQFYAGYAGPDLEQIKHDTAGEVCTAPIVETSTAIPYSFGPSVGHLVLRSRTAMTGDGHACRQATWHVELENGSKSPPLLVLEYFGADPAFRALADTVIDHPNVRHVP